MDDNENLNNEGVNSKKEKNNRKVDNLINIVENHTRTQRHLEQYSEIGDPEYKEMARNKQDLREKQINELKNQLTGNDKNELGDGRFVHLDSTGLLSSGLQAFTS